MYKYQSNSCIYCFKLTNTILLLIMSICILSFGNIHLFNIDTHSCNHIGLSIILMILKSIFQLIYILWKSFKYIHYYHTNLEGFGFLFFIFITLYNVRLLINTECSDHIWKTIPFCYYFIFSYFLIELFMGIPILIYHSFVPLIRTKYTDEEKLTLVNNNY
jgi:hypothetical protein